MNENCQKALELLKTNELTLAAVSDNDEITSTQRGVKPLLELLDSGKKLCGFSAADKVIGKAAAFLYVLLEADEIYTYIISEPALGVLNAHGIKVTYETLSPAIRNRTNTGFCPMETAVKETSDPEEALTLIRNKLSELNSNTK